MALFQELFSIFFYFLKNKSQFIKNYNRNILFLCTIVKPFT